MSLSLDEADALVDAKRKAYNANPTEENRQAYLRAYRTHVHIDSDIGIKPTATPSAESIATYTPSINTAIMRRDPRVAGPSTARSAKFPASVSADVLKNL